MFYGKYLTSYVKRKFIKPCDFGVSESARTTRIG